jgi:deoxyribose-phosphate aldolase
MFGKLPEDLASIIDHTLLRAGATRDDIERLCREAEACQFWAVCVNPSWVPLAASLLVCSRVRVSSVVAFPFGASATEVKVHEARLAIMEGAREIDFVINIGALKSGDVALVTSDLSAVVAICRAEDALSKVIIETALLTDEEKKTACRLARDAGADYVKTSTGFGPAGATAADVALMRSVVGAEMGVKAAGGIRDFEAVRQLVMAGATRVGTSAGVQILKESRARAARGCP